MFFSFFQLLKTSVVVLCYVVAHEMHNDVYVGSFNYSMAVMYEGTIFAIIFKN